jgi:hypothetical protein
MIVTCSIAARVSSFSYWTSFRIVGSIAVLQELELWVKLTAGVGWLQDTLDPAQIFSDWRSLNGATSVKQNMRLWWICCLVPSVCAIFTGFPVLNYLQTILPCLQKLKEASRHLQRLFRRSHSQSEVRTVFITAFRPKLPRTSFS